MWFKNLAIYRFTEDFTLSDKELQHKLTPMLFKPCGHHEQFSFGWEPPLGQLSEQLVHSANGFMMICARKQEKVLPTAVINELLTEQISAAEQQQARKLSKKEKTELKEELIFDLLPKAFVFSKRSFAYIDLKGGWIIVDSATTKKAEDLLSNLRKCLGSLPIVPLTTKDRPAAVMTRWLADNQTPADITIEDECELRATQDEGAVIRCKRHDLSLPEIKNHLDSGKQVIKLAVSWADRLAFIVDENLAIKRLRFLDLIQDQVNEVDSEDAATHFDVEFAIMSLELANFLPRLIELFGGENPL
jgi:recombination associated protein RdgC